MGIVQTFHRFKFLRRAAKVAARKISIKQKFYGGYIFLNAVEHSWAWTGKVSYMNFDVELQQYLHRESQQYDHLIDVGSNIGVMTVGTLLNNPSISAVAVDPNKEAIRLLTKTLKFNGLEERCTVIRAAAGISEKTVKFDPGGSVTGHISSEGESVDMIRFADLLNRYSERKTLVKVDVEGFESELVKDIQHVNNLQNFKFLIEFHEKGFNGVGDPQFVLDTLTSLGGTLTDIRGRRVTKIDPHQIHQLAVTFS